MEFKDEHEVASREYISVPPKEQFNLSGIE